MKQKLLDESESFSNKEMLKMMMETQRRHEEKIDSILDTLNAGAGKIAALRESQKNIKWLVGIVLPLLIGVLAFIIDKLWEVRTMVNSIM